MLCKCVSHQDEKGARAEAGRVGRSQDVDLRRPLKKPLDRVRSALGDRSVAISLDRMVTENR
jgi:hypothetical protein